MSSSTQQVVVKKLTDYETKPMRPLEIFLIPDPRVDTLGYPVAGNPLRFVPIVIVYTLMCIYGPKIMASRKAFELKIAMIWYNFVQVAVNLLYVIWVNRGFFFCENIFQLFSVSGNV